jgi:hypothetical protein
VLSTQYSIHQRRTRVLAVAGERLGCGFLATSSQEIAIRSQSVLESLQRSVISNPPAFGTRVAEAILADDTLRKVWFEDLDTMSPRILAMRELLYKYLIAHCVSSILFKFIFEDVYRVVLTRDTNKYSNTRELGSSRPSFRHVRFPWPVATRGQHIKRYAGMIRLLFVYIMTVGSLCR